AERPGAGPQGCATGLGPSGGVELVGDRSRAPQAGRRRARLDPRWSGGRWTHQAERQVSGPQAEQGPPSLRQRQGTVSSGKAVG
ncbi:unnamed protein product, partial [Staurois parvus]